MHCAGVCSCPLIFFICNIHDAARLPRSVFLLDTLWVRVHHKVCFAPALHHQDLQDVTSQVTTRLGNCLQSLKQCHPIEGPECCGWDILSRLSLRFKGMQQGCLRRFDKCFIRCGQGPWQRPQRVLQDILHAQFPVLCSNRHLGKEGPVGFDYNIMCGFDPLGFNKTLKCLEAGLLYCIIEVHTTGTQPLQQEREGLTPFRLLLCMQQGVSYVVSCFYARCNVEKWLICIIGLVGFVQLSTVDRTP